MSTTQLIAWVWRMMLMLQPASITPWVETYEATAIAFVDEATRLPLFSGSTAIEQTVSTFLSVAWYEGRFDPKAKGDCKERQNGKCISQPQSLCMFQIGRSNLNYLGITEEQILTDIRICTHAARTMMKTSFAVCKGFSNIELLGHYASGGSTCGGLKESRNRMRKAEWIFGQRFQSQD